MNFELYLKVAGQATARGDAVVRMDGDGAGVEAGDGEGVEDLLGNEVGFYIIRSP